MGCPSELNQATFGPLSVGFGVLGSRCITAPPTPQHYVLLHIPGVAVGHENDGPAAHT